MEVKAEGLPTPFWAFAVQSSQEPRVGIYWLVTAFGRARATRGLDSAPENCPSGADSSKISSAWGTAACGRQCE